jgi:hypothetical protein
MKREELAQYLVNLHTLMAAQTVTSSWLADEYQRVWDELKAELKPKEKQ